MLWTPGGRIPRSTYWSASVLLWSAFIVLFVLLDSVTGANSTLLLYPPFFWAFFALSAKRFHDRNRSAMWLLLALIPIVGVLWIGIELGLRGGTRGDNRYGASPLELPHDYQTVA